MGDVIQISATTAAIIGTIMTVLLAIIAFFLGRLIKQFDKLQEQFTVLNATMVRIDKDLSGDVGVLKSKMDEFEPIWDRMRQVEHAVTTIQAGGCNYCKGKQ